MCDLILEGLDPEMSLIVVVIFDAVCAAAIGDRIAFKGFAGSRVYFEDLTCLGICIADGTPAFSRSVCG